MRRPAFLAICCLLLAGASPLWGAESLIESVEVGFSGHYRAGEWTPLTISLTEQAGQGPFVVETVTADAAGTTVVRQSEPRSPTSAEGARRLQTVFQAGRLGSDLTVRILTPNGEGRLLDEVDLQSGTEQLPRALTAATRLWVTGIPLPEAEPDEEPIWSPGLQIATAAGPMPIDPRGYAGADVLILPGDVSMSAEAFAAVRKYVAGGGRVALSLGDRTGQFEASPLAEWVPIETNGTIQLREFSDLEEAAGSKRRLPARARVRIAAIEEAQRSVIAWKETGWILVARGPFGFGAVTLFAMDLTHPTFQNWPALPALVEQVLLRLPEGGGGDPGGKGMGELATQLLRAQDDFPGLARVPVGRTLILLLVYAVIVGPLDYLIVHRWLRRPVLTWMTLPLIVVAAACWLNARASATNGTQSRYNQLTLIDHDLASGTRRGRSIVTLYSAEAQRLGLAVDRGAFGGLLGEARASDDRTTLRWIAVPEETFGGLYRDAAGGLFLPRYAVNADGTRAAAEDIPLLAFSSRQFQAQWQRGDTTIDLEADLAGSGDGYLRGWIEHRFDRPLKHWMIVYGSQVYLPQAIVWEAGQRLLVNSAAFSRRDLRSYLTGQTQIRIDTETGASGAEYFLKAAPYDRTGVDVNTIVKMLSFHESAGGRTYTGLENSFWSRQDLTAQLELGRAVLWGVIEENKGGVVFPGESAEQWDPARRRTFVRIVLPVNRVPGSFTDPLAVEDD